MVHNYEHKKLIETIIGFNKVPEDSGAFSQWIQAKAQLHFLVENARSNEVVTHAVGHYSFVHSVVVPNANLMPIDQDDLLGWDFNHYIPIAGYVSELDRDDMRIERGLNGTGTESLEGAIPLVFARTFEGWSGSGHTTYELHQEYAHVTNIYWRPEKRAYCRFNDLGDLEPVVSITTNENKGGDISLVSFKWKQLEEYLVASQSSLVRMFDFTLYRPSTFSGWSNTTPLKVNESNYFFYRQLVIEGYAAYTRGVQIIQPRVNQMKGRGFGRGNREYAEFVAQDWRNNRVTNISTDPNATTNYFSAEHNSLPFELSPAFFRPEVLLKYKADRDKYTVGERHISCRNAWYLKGFDVNEAGQVHAYIRDLRQLPYTEQLHWLSFNEPPQTGISKRALTSDFEGSWTNLMTPPENVRSIVRRWHETKIDWWTLRDTKLLDQLNTPLSDSRDEWAEAFMDLAKLVVEGFETRPIRAKLATNQIPYETEERTLTLLEKLLNKDKADAQKLTGLRTVQLLRSKAKGHVTGSEAVKLAEDALSEHETFAKHFQFVCAQVADELETIEQILS